jgi:hypothetical protein
MRKTLTWIVMLLILVTASIAAARVLISERAKTAFTFRPQALTATANGTAVDRTNYGSAIGVLDVGAVSGTSPTLDCKWQESSTSGGTYTDISGAAHTQVTAANTRSEKSIDLAGKKLFIRGTCTVGGTSPSFTMGMIVVLGEPGTHPLP